MDSFSSDEEMGNTDNIKKYKNNNYKNDDNGIELTLLDDIEIPMVWYEFDANYIYEYSANVYIDHNPKNAKKCKKMNLTNDFHKKYNSQCIKVYPRFKTITS